MPHPEDPQVKVETFTHDLTVALNHLYTSLEEEYTPTTFIYNCVLKPDEFVQMQAPFISLLHSKYRESFWNDDITSMPLQFIIISSFSCPEDYAHLFYNDQFEIPNLEELATIVTHINSSADNQFISEEKLPQVAKAALGMSESEFINVCLNSILDNNVIDPDYIYNIKMADIKKNGILEIIRPKVSFDNIGGLDNIKDVISKNSILWHKSRKSRRVWHLSN